MSTTQIWGTSLQPAEFALRRRATSDGDVRVTDEGDTRVAYISPAQIKFRRVTSVGDVRVTSAGDRRVTLQGLAGPAYFQTTDVTSDGGEPFGFAWTSLPWQPSAQGGENEFIWAYLGFSWSMAALVRVTPIVDGNTAALVVPGGSIETVRSVFRLEQQGLDLQRVTRVVAVPLVRQRKRTGRSSFTRFYMRGERLQLAIESTGPLGVGELMLDSAEIEFEPVRKADYPGQVDATG